VAGLDNFDIVLKDAKKTIAQQLSVSATVRTQPSGGEVIEIQGGAPL